jgi:hypothetical protein
MASRIPSIIKAVVTSVSHHKVRRISDNEQQVPKCNAQETIPAIAPKSAQSAWKAGVHQASLVLLAPCGQEWPEPPTLQSHQDCEPAEEGATLGSTQALCGMAAHMKHARLDAP